MFKVYAGEDMMKILVTGGAGYIGSILSGTPLSEGYEVTSPGHLIYEQNSLLPHFHYANFQFFKREVLDKRVVKSFLL